MRASRARDSHVSSRAIILDNNRISGIITTLQSVTLDAMHSMKNIRLKLIFALFLLWPMVGWSHALNPIYYPLGPVPFFLWSELRPFIVLIPLSIAIETLVLWAWARGFGTLGNLWRAGILYIAARAAETGIIFLVASIPGFRNIGDAAMRDSIVENFGPLLLLLTTGLVASIPVGLLLFKGTGIKPRGIAVAVCAASLAGYLAAFGYSLLLTGMH
jgi:hypothetical protein